MINLLSSWFTESPTLAYETTPSFMISKWNSECFKVKHSSPIICCHYFPDSEQISRAGKVSWHSVEVMVRNYDVGLWTSSRFPVWGQFFCVTLASANPSFCQFIENKIRNRISLRVNLFTWTFLLVSSAKNHESWKWTFTCWLGNSGSQSPCLLKVAGVEKLWLRKRQAQRLFAG